MEPIKAAQEANDSPAGDEREEHDTSTADAAKKKEREMEESGQENAAQMRVLAIGIAVALIVFALTGGHVIFLPLLFIPLGLFGFGHRRRRRSIWP